MNKQELFLQIKVRKFEDKNYHAIWHNLKTLRLGKGAADELEPEFSEFYDVGINTCCNAMCDFCYVSASDTGINYPDICETWKKWMSTYPEDIISKFGEATVIETKKPFQIAIGSSGEPTLHPQFCDFLETVFNTGVVPNYTTNGMILSDAEKAKDILAATEKYCGGVAVSFGNIKLRKYAEKAIENLSKLQDVKINLHHIISDKASVDTFLEIQDKYKDTIYYHVLLPLMPSGRSLKGLEEGTWEYLESKLSNKKILKRVSFGAHFIDKLKTSKGIYTWLYPAESLSKNIILTKDCVKITPSSFNMNPIKEIKL